MSWLASIGVAVLSGVLGFFVAGAVMSQYVRWHRFSSMEGQAGYAIVMVSFIGAASGLVLGLAVSRTVPDDSSFAFVKGLGLALGAVLLGGGVFAAIGRAMADLPPTIDGHELLVELEFRLAPEVEASPAAGTGESRIALGSNAGRVHATGSRGHLRHGDTRREDGQWIVPGHVPLTYRRGQRIVSFQLSGGSVIEVVLSVPSRPGSKHDQWSEWAPCSASAAHPSFRFRVRKIEPEPSREPEVPFSPRSFAAMDPDAPLADWLVWTRKPATMEQRKAARERIVARPTFAADMREMILSGASRPARTALELIQQLPDPAFIDPVTDVGHDIAERIRDVNAMPPDSPELGPALEDASLLFGSWITAVRALRKRCDGDFTPELIEILQLARVLGENKMMRIRVVRIASHLAHEWAGVEPLPADPKPF